MYRYYSIHRPVEPGTFPESAENKVVNYKNFDEAKFCNQIGRKAWGYVEYENPVSPDLLRNYELVSIDEKQEYAVEITTVAEYVANGCESNSAAQERQSLESKNPVFDKLPSKRQQELSGEIKTTLHMLIDADIQTTGKLTAETLEAIATQGYVYRDGNLVKQDALTKLQKKAIKIFRKYEKLPMRERIGIIAQAFGCTSGEIKTSPCFGKWRGTSDMFIRFDNGAFLFVGNRRTPEAKTKKVQNEYINDALLKYNPEIIAATKEAALPVLRERETRDNEIAAQKGLKSYIVLNVEFYDTSYNGGFMGWYYVTLAVDGKICSHIETGLNFDIADGKVNAFPKRANYYPAGALKDTDVDYVFNNVGFSSASDLYSLPISDEVRERAEKTLAERKKE